MIHYLRRNGKTIVDVSATTDDIRSVVCILEYTRFFRDETDEPDRQDEIMEDFDDLQELRGEFHETPNQKETPDELAGRRLKYIGKKYGLAYVTD